MNQTPDIGAFQQQLLDAVITQTPLPGHNQPVRLPDLGMLMAQEDIPIARDGLDGSILLPAAPKPVRLADASELSGAPATPGTTCFLTFDTLETGLDMVRIALRLKLAANPGQPVLGLSSVIVTFRRTQNGWQADEPVYMAN